jgi:GDP-L-fucose synthase
MAIRAMKDKKVLITGASGLVGSAIDIPNAVRVSSKDYNLTIQEHVQDLVHGHNPTHIIHCAAKVGGLGANMEEPANFFEDNILINTMLLATASI